MKKNSESTLKQLRKEYDDLPNGTKLWLLCQTLHSRVNASNESEEQKRKLHEWIDKYYSEESMELESE